MVFGRIAGLMFLSAALPIGTPLAAQNIAAAGDVSGTAQPVPIADAANCRAGDECAVEGAIRISKRRGVPAARIDTAAGCFAVALTRSQRKLVRDDGPARVLGFAYGYYPTSTVKYYRVRDRWSGTGKCASGTMLYATAIDRLDTPSQ